MNNSSLQQKLRNKQQLIQQIRNHFALFNVTEVFTEHLSSSCGTDVHIEPFKIANKSLFLHTSPEFAMKKLLAKGSGDIFQICQVYRRETEGNWHNKEFQMLEWYRVGWSIKMLIKESIDLIQKIYGKCEINHLSIKQACENFASWSPWQKNALSIANQKWPNGPGKDCLATWFDYVMIEHIEPNIKDKGLVVLFDFPKTHASLAKLTKKENMLVAERFEIYLNGIELANGFAELNDPIEQQQRFNEDLATRKSLNLSCLPVDFELLKSLETLPDCCGVALGIDRLLAIKANSNLIELRSH